MAEFSNDSPAAGLDTGADAGAGGDAGAGAPEAPSLRDDLDAAFRALETDESGRPPPAPGMGGDRQRDDQGRFAPAAARPPAGVTQPAPRPGQQQAGAGQQQAGQHPRAPNSWNSATRAKWDAAVTDPDVRAEIHRREGEHQQLMQTAAQYRQFAQVFEDIVRPYEVFIASEGSNPLQAVQHLLSTAAQLYVAGPQTKAVLIGNLIGQYGVDIKLLDDYLDVQRKQGMGWANPQAGQQAQAVAQAAQAHAQRDPRIDQLFAYLNNTAAQQQAVVQANAVGEVEHFGSLPGHEYFPQVREIMAGLMEAAANAGHEATLDEAYKIACQLHPEVAKLGTTQPLGNNAFQQTQAALRARRAASSVRGEAQPHGVNAARPGGENLRTDIETAWDMAERAMR